MKRHAAAITPRDQHGGPGVIEPGVLYLAEEARQRLRMGAWAWRSVRRAGLQVIYVGRNAYVFGDDLLAFFRQVQSAQTKYSPRDEAPVGVQPT